ncbi:MAG: valine--tRNA ligase [Planctomycetota bacterium]
MEIDLSTRYEPARIEDRVYELWVREGCFRSVVDHGRPPFVIVIPPPNVTGALHMGHALNVTLQDILIRWRRMEGRNALWLPGTDHAGIATQNVVEKELAARGEDRHTLGRERLVEEIWKWKQLYGDRILEQLKRLGCSCDWERTRFTMDDGLSKAVREAFVALYDRGLIYRGNYIINWCPRCQTSLSDEEVDHRDVEGKLWYIRYQGEGAGKGVVVATTRPETMLGDTAVAVNPKDERYRGLVGTTVILPVIGRRLPIIADEYVDAAFGTGAVKVTPAHDPNDFEMGRRHGLPSVNVMSDSGRMNENAGEYAGMDRFECRRELVKRLEAEGLIERLEPHALSVGMCYRCDTVVEPRISLQWFVRMKPLAEKALSAQDAGRVEFHPSRWTKVYRAWLENVRDWCISRQIWWGHRIPVWHCLKCDHMNVALEAPTRCAGCGAADLRQDEDVLDTWFSSALWPFSTLGWPDVRAREELSYYYPTDVLVTARDIIYFWVARMIMMGLEMMGEVPFRHVVINGTVLDEIGRRMSKSLGNGIDPLEMIDAYGADAVRFSLAVLSTDGQDIKLAPTRFEMGRNFANKLWNAARFALMGLHDIRPPKALAPDGLSFVNRWMLSRTAAAAGAVTDALERSAFNEAAMALYALVWHDFCDWYLELSKPALRGDDGAQAREETQQVLAYSLDCALRLLHPFAPFVTEELWTLLGNASPKRTIDARSWTGDRRLVLSGWPGLPEGYVSAETEGVMATLQEITRAVRNIRRSMDIEDRTPVELLVSCAEEETARRIAGGSHVVVRMGNLRSMNAGRSLARPPASATAVFAGGEVFVPLRGLIDFEAERKRLRGKLVKLEGHLAGADAKLGSKAFLERAPEDVVVRHREMRAETARQIDALRTNLSALEEEG